jgi:glutamine amidotransferase
MHCFDPADIMLLAEHGIAFVAGIEHENIIGVQFHPEKSHKFGKIIFENFLNLY